MIESAPRHRPRWVEIAVMAGVSVVLLATILVYERGSLPWLAVIVLPPIWIPYIVREPVRARPLVLTLAAGLLVLLLFLGLYIAIR